MLLTYSRILQLLLCISTCLSCHGMKRMLLKGGSKCVTLDTPMDTMLEVRYEAPDAKLDETSKDYSASYVTINVNPTHRVLDSINHPSLISQRLKPTSHLIEEKYGRVKHRVEVDGVARVCIKTGGNNDSYMLFGLDVVDAAPVDPNEPLGPVEDINDHLSHMEMEMKRIQNGMKMILGEADYAKERDAIYHTQTLSMHSATTFWPIVQVCVLLMTGYTQASNIVRFFQSRRII